MSDTIPYPDGPHPDDVPDDLTALPDTYVRQEWLLLASQGVFLLTYLLAVVVLGLLAGWLAVLTPRVGVLAGVGALGCALLFVFLGKGLFRTADDDPDMLAVEVTEAEQPTLFAFIRRVCQETGADEPRKVLLVPDVNAGVYPRVSLKSLFVPPEKDLIVGLGLVNCVTLGEFKSIMAHEFGHFTQREFVSAYSSVLDNIVRNILRGQDALDRAIREMGRRDDALAGLAVVVGAGPKAVSWLLVRLAVLFDYAHWELRREREFHADLVAAAVAGSNAATHALLRTGFGSDTFEQAMADLRKAADHRLHTADLYYHQHAAAAVVRRREKNPTLGEPPYLAAPRDGERVQVFDPQTTFDPATVGDYHPSNHEREENVKARFVPCPDDDRTPWLLFDNPADLRERLTYKVYRTHLRMPKGTPLDEPERVQAFIDAEHQETTYDPRYAGVYDDRLINPGDVDALDEQIRKEPWDDARLITVYRRLYHDVQVRADERAGLMKNRTRLLESGKGGRKARRHLKEIDGELERHTEWFESLDRRAYLVFVQMAYRVSHPAYYDLTNRYRFQLAVQRMYRTARTHQEESLLAWLAVTAADDPHPDDVGDLMNTLRAARSALKKMLRDARDLDLPAMKNFEEGDRLADFLLDQELVRELPETYFKGVWVDRLLRQLDQVKEKAARLHGKSLGRILALQEEVAAKFLAGREPVDAIVLESA